ncbi:MAG: peptidase prolyl oligopeptidase active site domain protein [Thermomicrobiales bacterium]|nr:peptidase prolyl oligopeptidase active site domain protein [Thermomicrobiales bacterium]
MVTKTLPADHIATAEMAAAGATDVISPEELADRVMPSDAGIAPDGSRVAFVAAPVGKKGEHRSRAIWIAESGQPARQLTAGTADDHAPRWSPDGTRLLFQSDRLKPGDDEQRLFLLPLGGGEARPLGDLSGELSQPAWSPDGRFVAVLRQDPESPEAKARKKDRDDAVVVEEEPRFTRLWVIDVESGKARCLTAGEREVRGFAWAPDGKSLVAISTDAVEYDAVLRAGNVWQIAVAGGMPRHIACLRTMPSSPVVVETESGQIVAMLADGHRDQPSDSIWVVPLGGGDARNLMPGLTGVVEEIAPLPGAPGQVAARIIERTHGRIYAVDVTDGTLTPLTPPALAEQGSVLDGITFAANGRRVAAIWSDATTPEEVYLGDVQGAIEPVTSFGEAFRGRLQPTEHVTWLSDGVEIEGILTYPAGYQPGVRYPLVVEIHGGPSWQWEDRAMLDWHDWAQMLASRGYAVLMPNPRGSTGYGHAFQQMLQDDVGGGESRDLVAGALAMVERGIAERDRLGIAGWSWGGYLTAWTITQTDIFRAAVMGAGLSNMVSDHGQGDIPSANLLYYPGQPYDHIDSYWNSSPIRYVAAVRTPTLILHGDEDARVHPAQGMEFFRALKIRGVPVRFVRYPREKHGFEERAHQIDLMQRIIDWFEQHLRG